MIKNSNPKKTKYVITHANILGTFLSSNFFTKGSNNHAIINPIKIGDITDKNSPIIPKT